MSKYTIVCAMNDYIVDLKDNSPEAYAEGMKELKDTYCDGCPYCDGNGCPYDITLKDINKEVGYEQTK